jgi:hypothetical protein
MQILTVSDEVVPVIYSLSARERVGDVACIFGCGDLPYYYLEYLVTTLAVPCFYVLGNHDGNEQTDAGEVLTEPRGCTSLEGRTAMFEASSWQGLAGVSATTRALGRSTPRQRCSSGSGGSRPAWPSTRCDMAGMSIFF